MKSKKNIGELITAILFAVVLMLAMVLSASAQIGGFSGDLGSVTLAQNEVEQEGRWVKTNECYPMAKFIAHFMTPEGEPYPFDVIISDGEWVQEFDSVTYVETEVPCNATYTLLYSFGEDELRSRLYFPFLPGEIRQFEFYAHDLSEWYTHTRPMLTYQEIGAEPILTWQWDEINNTLTYNVTVSDTSKLVGNAVFVGFYTAPLYAIEELQFVGELSPCSGHKCSSHTAQYIHSVYMSDFYCMVKYAEIDPDFGALRVGSAFHNDAYILVTWEEASFLWDMNGILYEPEFIDPQYALPPGNYIVQVYGLPEAYVTPRMPIRIQQGIEIYFELFPPSLPINAGSFTFHILSERPFTNVSYSNLSHVGDSITLDVMTGEYVIQDWWGYFILPDTVTVVAARSYDGTAWHDLDELYDYTINPVDGYNIVVVRISPTVERLSLKYDVDRWTEINDELDELIAKVNNATMPNIIKRRLIDKLEYAKELKENAHEEYEAGNINAATKKLGVAKSQVESFASMVEITRRISEANKREFLRESAKIIEKIDRLIESL